MTNIWPMVITSILLGSVFFLSCILQWSFIYMVFFSDIVNLTKQYMIIE